jgi:hypothetical protein
LLVAGTVAVSPIDIIVDNAVQRKVCMADGTPEMRAYSGDQVPDASDLVLRARQMDAIKFAVSHDK